MDDVKRLAEYYFNSIKDWLTGLWNEFYGYLVSTLGETFAKMTLIVGLAGLVLFIYFSFQNRN